MNMDILLQLSDTVTITIKIIMNKNVDMEDYLQDENPEAVIQARQLNLQALS